MIFRWMLAITFVLAPFRKGAEGARRIRVQRDIDWERFIEMFVERMTAPVDSTRPDH